MNGCTMAKNTDKTIRRDRTDKESFRDEEFGYGTTAELSRKAFIEEIPIKQHACLEIIGSGKKKRVLRLGQGEVIIGRDPQCGIQLKRTIVSREHARINYHNEEYHIEDLGSTNGTHVNGIKIVKCVLRNNDQIDIGGVKILFTEEKTLQEI